MNKTKCLHCSSHTLNNLNIYIVNYNLFCLFLTFNFFFSLQIRSYVHLTGLEHDPEPRKDLNNFLSLPRH